MAIENTVSVDFDPRSSIVESVFDCRLPSVYTLELTIWGNSSVYQQTKVFFKVYT